MDEAECDALTEYVRSLPAPVAIKPADKQESEQLRSGERTFRSIGCANCHLPKLGSVSGIYSDLLLHDMGSRLEDAAAYSVFVGAPPRAEGAEAPDRPGTGTAYDPGVANAALVGPSRLGPLSARWPGRDHRSGDRDACRPGCVFGETLRGAFARSQAAPRHVPPVTRRSGGEPMTGVAASCRPPSVLAPGSTLRSCRHVISGETACR